MSVAFQPSRFPDNGRTGEQELDLPALGAALWRKRWSILIPTIGAALVALGVLHFIPAKYQSEARVLIEEHGNVFLRPDVNKDLADRGTVNQEAVSSQVQLILSRDLASEVIAKLKLGERPEFDPVRAGISPIKRLLALFGLVRNPLSMTPEERVLEAYYARLTVYPVEKSRVIAIDFLSEDPELAARVANAIADGYLVRQQAAKQEQARSAGVWLASEIDSMRRKVADAEAKVEVFRAKSNLLVGPNNTTLSAQQLGDVNAQLAAVREQKAEAEVKARLIRDSLRSKAPIESSDILNSELIRRLSEQRVTLRAQLAEQSSSLLDSHPRIKELKAQIADLDNQIRAEAETLARSFESDAKIASARADSLTAYLDQLKSQAASTNEQDVKLRALDREAKSERDLLESYLAKYREATARDAINSAPADARVISRATVSNVPAYPKKLPTVLIAAFGMLVLCSGWVLTRELLATPAGVAAGPAYANAPPARRVAAVSAGMWRRPGTASRPAPEPEPEFDFGRGAVATEEALPFVDTSPGALEDVAENLQRAGDDGRRIAVLGVAPEDETAAAALGLSRALAETGRVVLVGLSAGDAVMRAASGDPDAADLSDLIAGSASFGDIITRDRQSRVDLIAAGHAPAGRAAVVAAPNTSTIFAALARSYDHLVLDAGASEGAELETLGALAPHAVLVAQAPESAATAEACERLIAAGFADVTVFALRPPASVAQKAVAA